MSDTLGLIANQMMKGINGKYKMLDVPQPARIHFKILYTPVILKLSPHLPRGSAAIGAVLCKCMLKYGDEKPIAMAEALKTGVFNGSESAKLLWDLLLRFRGKDPAYLYKHAVTAARAYCEDRQIAYLRPAKKDIFEWDENWNPVL